ncbi:MAG: hypothetical protein M1813_005616 [Trichoglossum hirsutum]|nr:MAG: hypothetical protein M1813_005616 [Trichoglossum hirsutum]
MSSISGWKPSRRILFIDAYDSFSWNIVDLLQKVLGVEVFVIKTDAIFVEEEFLRLLRCFDAVLVGPGPGNPNNKQDIGLIDSLWKLEDKDILPILGICLGFQSLALSFGASIERLRLPQHGQVATVTHNGTSIFRNIGTLRATLYHSLHARIYGQSLGHGAGELWVSKHCPLLEPLAWNLHSGSDSPVLMGTKHVVKPFWGVQFHPESICSNGECKEMIKNWYEDSLRWNFARNRSFVPEVPSSVFGRRRRGSHVNSRLTESMLPPRQYQVITETLDQRNLTVSGICEVLSLPKQDMIVLESASIRQGLGTHSIIGVLSNDYMRIEYSVGESVVRLLYPSGTSSRVPLQGLSVWQWLDDFMRSVQITGGNSKVPFWGGFMGVFSYEMGLQKYLAPSRKGNTPDISLALVQRSVVFDHQEQQIYIQSIIEEDSWPKEVVKLLSCPGSFCRGQARLRPEARDALSCYSKNATAHLPDEETYKASIRQAQEFLSAGDSYQLCLTDETVITVPSSEDPYMPWHLYNLLCEKNPAPFAAYVSLGDLKVLSSSPEQFFRRQRQGNCSLRPMKGTVKKTAEMTRRKAEAILATPKESAENLMIVDLIRHDLHSAMKTEAAVTVPELMVIEDFHTVYSMSSRINAIISDSAPKERVPTALETLSECLPPGSMTGAPKKRSCEILNSLESRPRQVYSGVLGYLDFGGAAQFSVLIRSVFKSDEENIDTWRIGAGGAVTILSTEQGEWEEMITKLESSMGIFRSSAGA